MVPASQPPSSSGTPALPLPLPPSGHQQVDDVLQDEALSLYGLDPASCEATWTPTVGGVNNVTRRIIVHRRRCDSHQAEQRTDAANSGGEATLSCILRVYRNNNDTRRVAMEHLVLDALRPFNGGSGAEVAGAAPPFHFGFATPQPIPSLRGNLYEVLSNGACCCMFACIPGSLARTCAPQTVGAAAGAVSRALSIVSDAVRARSSLFVNLPGAPAPPYHDLWNVHHAIGSRDAFERIVRAHEDDPEWFATDARSAAWAYILRRLDVVEHAIAELQRSAQQPLLASGDVGMREQLIHGDLHYDNVLIVNADGAAMVRGDGTTTQVVSGVLDFEFVAVDWRPMELAICLSKYLGEDDPMQYCRPFVHGYLPACGPEAALSPVERAAVPECIALRILSNVVYFVGRAASGEDSIDALTTRVHSYRKRLVWLEANAAALVRAMDEVL